MNERVPVTWLSRNSEVEGRRPAGSRTQGEAAVQPARRSRSRERARPPRGRGETPRGYGSMENVYREMVGAGAMYGEKAIAECWKQFQGAGEAVTVGKVLMDLKICRESIGSIRSTVCGIVDVIK
ncbi:hypothetical protein TREES_T100017106 [Tupaia chinensis]|uniref:Uncharacterized protein n=1 Tax=Tupaia chinensis TaxID=246437 RepID=L9KPS4_TUPCH|nr:hypothetical protein TREES_T100017106 [Tupaia chinensis]